MRHDAMTRSFLCAMTLLAAAALAACGASADSVPTSPTPATTTSTFSGTIAQQGWVEHQFAVSKAGTVTVSLTSVTPLSTMALGVAIESSDGTTCGTTIVQNAAAKAGATGLSGTTASGNYCLRVYDPGNIPADWQVSYTVDVVHP